MSSTAPKENMADFFNRMGRAIKENDFETIKDGFEPFQPHRQYGKYGRKLLTFAFTADGKENSTLLHYALRNNASNDILKFLATFPHKTTDKSEGQTYYDIAIEKKNFVAQVLFIPDDEKLRLVNETKHAFSDINLDILEELLKHNMVIFGLSFAPYSSAGYKSIFSYAIDIYASPEIFEILLKYAKIYDIEHVELPIYDAVEIYTEAYDQELPKSVLKLLEPKAAVNSKVLEGLKINNAPAMKHPAGSAAVVAANTGSPSSSSSKRKRYEIRTIEGLEVMTILKGTLLFNAYEVMTPETRKLTNFGDIFHPDNTYLQLLNGILPLSTSIIHDDKTIKIKGCIDKNSAKFFYANPAGGPALGDVNTRFNTLAAFELKHDINLILLMSPAYQHRLEGADNKTIFTCNNLSEKYGKSVGKKDKTAYCRCTYNKTLDACPFAFPYDVCIKPEFLKKHNIHGHVAMAEADSYDKKMEQFDSDFAMNTHIPDTYKNLNSLLFESCVSLDKRPGSAIADELIGFPEIVLQLYGAQWYEPDLHEQHFEDEIAIENNDPAATIVKYLLNVNTSRLFPNADNPLKLKYVSTSRALYNLTNGNVIQNPFMHLAVYSEIQRNFATYYYLNYLEAFLRGELNFFVDPRNGFLMDATFANDILTNTGSTKGKTLLETSLALRKNESLYGYNKLLYPKYFRPQFIRTASPRAMSSSSFVEAAGTNLNNSPTSNKSTPKKAASVSSNSSNVSLSNILGGGITHRQVKYTTLKHKKMHKTKMHKQMSVKQHKTTRKAKKSIAPRYKVAIRHKHEPKFTTPLWIDKEYINICKIIKAYL